MQNLIIRSNPPLNAEPPLSRLRASFITPQPDFYIRCHGTIPQIDPAAYRLTINSLAAAPLTLSLATLQSRFAHRTVPAVMQCAGNRRADLQQIHPTTGDPWAAGAIGHARWTGIALADLLQSVGADLPDGAHVAFDCADVVDLPAEGRFTYGVSIPATKAADTLLAWAMNGEPLAPEHGFPFRAVVPGYAGVRSAKWLSTITVQHHPSANHMQQRDYKLLPPAITEATVDWAEGTTINEMPLNAAICEPADGAVLPAGATTVKGYAVCTEREIVRIDLSRDGGATWIQAELEPNAGSAWSWLFWTATLPLPPGRHELVVRAWDSACQTQPADPGQVWNFKGYLCASWHRVRVAVR